MLEPLVVSTPFWEVELPGDWRQVPFEPQEMVYFEAANGAAGVYVSVWRPGEASVAAAVRQAVVGDARRLLDLDLDVGVGEWTVTQRDLEEQAGRVEAWSEYHNAVASYFVTTRYLGHEGVFVRATYHDYACTDEAYSRAASTRVLQSLVLVDQSGP